MTDRMLLDPEKSDRRWKVRPLTITPTVLCDYPGCVSWGSCPHSQAHAKIVEGGGYPLDNLVCGTCSYDLNATCWPVTDSTEKQPPTA